MSLLTFLNKSDLLQRVPQDSPIYGMLEQDKPESLSSAAVVDASRFILARDYAADQVSPILDAQVLVGYAMSKMADHVPRYLMSVADAHIYGPE